MGPTRRRTLLSLLLLHAAPAAALVAPCGAGRPRGARRRGLARVQAERSSWAKENPALLAFVCGGLFGLLPHARELAAASPEDWLRAAYVGPSPGRWPFLGFAPVVGLAASGTLSSPKVRTLAASTVSFGVATQVAARVADAASLGVS